MGWWGEMPASPSIAIPDTLDGPEIKHSALED